MNVNRRKVRAGLITVSVVLGVASLFTNVYYVYKFGPPYRSVEPSDTRTRTFPAITVSHHKNPIAKARRNAPLGEQKTRKPSEKRKTFSSTDATTRSAAQQLGTTSRSIELPKQGSSFVLAASYSDSISLLPKSLLQLGQFAKDIAIRNVVVPWVFGYRVYGVKRLVAAIDKGQNSLALNRLYDLKSVNSVMSQCSGTTMTPFTDFVQSASRNVSVVYFMRNKFIEPRQFHLLTETEKIVTEVEFKKAQVVDCLPLVKNNYSQTAGKGLIDALNAELSSDIQLFHLTSFICVDNSKIVKMEHIRNFISNSNHTVILLNWRGYASLLNKPYDLSRYWVESMNTFSGDKCHFSTMPFHFEVPRVAHQFLTHSGISGVDYLGVYVSVESLAKLNKSAYAECCLKEANRVIGATVTKYHLNQVIVVGDHSRQPSSSCDSDCIKRSTAMVTMMSGWGLNVTRFNPDATTAKHHHPSFNAFAEVSLLTTSKRLLLIGQNLWYSQIKARFIQHYPTDGISKLYTLCSNTGTYLRDLASKTIQC